MQHDEMALLARIRELRDMAGVDEQSSAAEAVVVLRTRGFKHEADELAGLILRLQEIRRGGAS